MVSTNHVKTAPVGLDKVLQDIQIGLYGFLPTVWSGALQGFGRAHRSPTDIDVPVPQWFNGIDYTDVRFDDMYAANFFYTEDKTHETTDGVVYEAKVKLCFMVNLEGILPGFGHSPDEEARLPIVQYLNENAGGMYDITSIAKGIEAVFLGWDTRNVKYLDLHPYHTFCVKMNVYYYL